MPWRQSMKKEELVDMYNYLASLIASKKLYVPIEKTYSLDEIKEGEVQADEAVEEESTNS